MNCLSVLAKIKQSKFTLQVIPRAKVCSVKQQQNLKGTRGTVTNMCKNISRVFDATCEKFNNTSKSNRLRVGKKWTF